MHIRICTCAFVLEITHLFVYLFKPVLILVFILLVFIFSLLIGEWGNIFGSRSVVVDNSCPLWYATFDNDDSSLRMKLPFGGWTSAAGKQYTDKSASGLFDLNIFA